MHMVHKKCCGGQNVSNLCVCLVQDRSSYFCQTFKHKHVNFCLYQKVFLRWLLLTKQLQLQYSTGAIQLQLVKQQRPKLWNSRFYSLLVFPQLAFLLRSQELSVHRGGYRVSINSQINNAGLRCLLLLRHLGKLSLHPSLEEILIDYQTSFNCKIANRREGIAAHLESIS